VITVQQVKERWRGVVVPLVTPFKANGDINLDALRTNVRWILDQGARQGNTIFLAAGSGGDFSSMNVEERKAVIRTVAEVNAGRIPIIAGAQSLDIRECIDICQLCEALEIDAVQISGPFYYDGRPGDVTAWIKEVARQTKVGFALYNNWYTGYDMPIDLIDQLLDVPNCVGVKWGSPSDEIFMKGVRRFMPRAAVVMNNRRLAVMGHMAGCCAFVSHFVNFYPQYPWRIWELLDARQYFEAQQELDRVMVPYEELRARVAQATAGEGVFVRPSMAAVGLDGGCSRLPSRDEAVTPEIREGFRRLLADIGAIR
jgi:4-hydroxy-tetrahydrodipicolinate synthase